MFDQRATAEELIDRPDCGPELAAASYRFMETVNRWFGAHATCGVFWLLETADAAQVVRCAFWTSVREAATSRWQ